MRHEPKTILKALFSTVVLLMAVDTAAGQDIRRSFDAKAGGRLRLDFETGASVAVIGGSASSIDVSVWKKGRDADDIDVDFEEEGHGLSIHSTYRTRHVNRSSNMKVEIRVPDRFDVDVETMGGSIDIENVAGRFDGRTMGGDIHLTKLRGDVSLTTMGGAIVVQDSELDGKVQTMGGDVRIDNVQGRLDGKSMGGDVTYVNMKRSGKGNSSLRDEVRIRSMGGDINVDDAPTGADVHTMGGDIHVRSASDHVKAETMGGDVVIGPVDGWIEARTMGGDIEAEVSNATADRDHQVRLVSMSGDVELTVPKDFDMDVDVEIAVTRNARRDYRIVSDFDIDQRSPDRWVWDQGSERRYVYGTGRIGQGKNRVRIKTVNGNVYIRKR